MKNNLQLLPIGLLAAALVLGGGGCAQSSQNVQAARETDHSDIGANQSLTASDRNFLKEAEEDSIKERNLGRVALEKSSNPAVRDYAQMLVDDHTSALRDEVDLMNRKGLKQPSGLPEIKHEALAELNGLSGSAFDHKFITQMVGDHQKAVAKFRQEAESANDKDVRNYAGKILPVLEKHLSKAQSLETKFSGGSEDSK